MNPEQEQELLRLMRAVNVAQNFYVTDASLSQSDWLALKRLAKDLLDGHE